MRTTIDIADPLFIELKTEAVQKGVKLKALIAQYIASGLSESKAPHREPSALPVFPEPPGPIIPSRTNSEIFIILDDEKNPA